MVTAPPGTFQLCTDCFQVGDAAAAKPIMSSDIWALVQFCTKFLMHLRLKPCFPILLWVSEVIDCITSLFR